MSPCCLLDTDAFSLTLLVHAHGGSRSKVYPVWRTSFGWEKVLRYYLSRGYFVMSVNYRSGIGYGLDFREPKKLRAGACGTCR